MFRPPVHRVVLLCRRDMSLDASDLIDNLLDDQARVNSAVDEGDINNVVADVQQITGEKVGLTGAETITPTSTGSPPHKYDDGQSQWGFASWG